MVSDRTLGQLRLDAALVAELAEPSTLLPSRSIERALEADVEKAAAFIQAFVAAGKTPATPEVVVAAKSGRGFRPVHALDIELRVLYRGLVDLLAPRVGYPDRSDEAYETFKRAPLTVDAATHVVRADVASFYQYVDHRLLESEIVSQTGEAQVASALLGVLGPIMGREFGLPQNTGASHAIADVYIDVVERQLLRLGLDVWRYNDDFAIATAGLRHARRALEDLERALRLIGLTPNDEKSLIHTKETYRAWVDRPAELRAQISEGLDVDLVAWILLPASGYEEDDEEEDDDKSLAAAAEEEAQIAGAVRTLEDWLDHIRSEDASNPLERYIYRALARDAIRVLRRRLSNAGLPFADSLLAYEPQMTHTVCRYLGRLASVDSSVMAFVSELVERSDTHLSVWQKLWILEPALAASEVPLNVLQWVSGIAGDQSSSLLRARAALVLATHGRISLAQLGGLFDSSTSAAKPDLVVAAVRASDGNGAAVRALADENEILRIVAESAREAL